MTKAIRAERVWSGGRWLYDAAVLVDGSNILAVQPAAEIDPELAIENWGAVAVLPGTVNAHGHAFQNLFKGFADDRAFASWRDDVLYPFSERLDGDAIYAGALLAFAEALLAGATTIVDFFYLHDDGNTNAERVIQAARDVGIRLVLARAFYDPDAPTQAPARYREPAEEASARFADLALAHAGDELVSIQPAPHSLHAARPETIRLALERAVEFDVPCHLHLAEAQYERKQVEGRYGASPVRLLAREGLLDARLVAVHAVWLDDEELDMVAEAGTAVVHCPGANAFLGDGIAALPEMLRRGIRVALGPDGGCANNRQSVFDEMRSASSFAKARLHDGGAMSAPTAFRLGTSAGGDVLGLPVGELAAGKQADLVAIDLGDLSLQPLQTLEYQIVNSMQSTAISKVMVGGEVVADAGRLTRVDHERIAELVEGVTAGWSRP